MNAFIIDVDGVMTDGTFHYTKNGKEMKVFGPDDKEALEILRPLIHIEFVTADGRGYAISKRRIVDDMEFPLTLVKDRFEWIDTTWGFKDVIYMGDSFLDIPLFHKVGYSICPSDGYYGARMAANYVTQHTGGHRAVAEACFHIKEKFFRERDDNYYNV